MSDLTVKILVGIPASGKSTWKEQFLSKNPKWIAVSRDSFRYMLTNSGWCEPKIESMITELMDISILHALANKMNVIVDNTNVKASSINAIIKLVNHLAKVEFQVFDISLKKAIERDNLRDRRVGVEVIERMYEEYKNLCQTFDFSNRPLTKKFYTPPKPIRHLPCAIIVDIDGTIAHIKDRSPYDLSRVLNDDPDVIIVKLVRQLSKDYKIIIVSGREDICEDDTRMWLNVHDIPFSELYMRKATDLRKDSVIKREIYEQLIQPKFDVKFVLDDRLQVVNMWRRLGLKCLQVADGYF